MIMTVFAGIAEFERDLIRERTGSVGKQPNSGGVRFGRPRKLDDDQVKVVEQLLSEGKVSGASHGLSGYTKARSIAWLLLRRIACRR
jgi:DNA invertase Pin-like site-specific DNA recombinase